jgi:hypothetical protein
MDCRAERAGAQCGRRTQQQHKHGAKRSNQMPRAAEQPLTENQSHSPRRSVKRLAQLLAVDLAQARQAAGHLWKPESPFVLRNLAFYREVEEQLAAISNPYLEAGTRLSPRRAER